MRGTALWLPALLVLAGCSTPTEPESPPNLVLVIVDDLAAGDVGFMGSKEVETPRLDALANSGTVFPNGYVTSSVCVPSIRSLLTGLDPYHQSQQMSAYARRVGRVTPLTEQSALLPTVPRRLREAGYVTFQGGKLWEASYGSAGFDLGTLEALDTHAVDGHRKKLDVPLGRETLQPLFDFLDAHQRERFFVWFAPKLPHAPFDAEPAYVERYEGRGLAPLALQYYANITRLDDVVGQLLDRIDALGLRDDTLVVLLSDNGWDQQPFREHARFPPDSFDGPRGKRTMYDIGFRTPIVLRWPGRIAPGVRDESLVSTLDVVETLADYAGGAPLANGTGISLRPLLEGREAWGRDRVVGAMVRPRIGAPERGTAERKRWLNTPGAYFVRTAQWHYIWRPFSATHELYEIAEDPRERHDVADRHIDITDAFRRNIEAWKVEIERNARADAAAMAPSRPGRSPMPPAG